MAGLGQPDLIPVAAIVQAGVAGGEVAGLIDEEPDMLGDIGDGMMGEGGGQSEAVTTATGLDGEEDLPNEVEVTFHAWNNLGFFYIR